MARNDILEFFQGLSVPLNGVHLMFNEREQPTGVAYVEFASSDERERAMTRDRQHMGGRYVELFRVSRAEMLQALEQFVGGYMAGNMMAHQGGAPPGTVWKPPKKRTMSSIVARNGTPRIRSVDGRASGEAWVTFANPAEAQRAMAKNNTHMGSRYIELFAA